MLHKQRSSLNLLSDSFWTLFLATTYERVLQITACAIWKEFPITLEDISRTFKQRKYFLHKTLRFCEKFSDLRMTNNKTLRDSTQMFIEFSAQIAKPRCYRKIFYAQFNILLERQKVRSMLATAP